MNGTIHPMNNERGAALIISIMLLAVLLVISMGLVKMTGTDLQISSNYKFYNEAFYNADEGVGISPGIIIRTVENQPNLDSTDSSKGYVADTTDDDGDGVIYFVEEILGRHDNDPDDADTDPDLSYTNASGHTVKVDVDRTGASPLPGASSEFGSRYEGVGSGSAGGVAIKFRVNSKGESSSNSSSNISAIFRCVERTGGCLQ